MDDDCSGRVLGPEEGCKLLVAFHPPEEHDGEELRAVISVWGSGASEVLERILLVASQEDSHKDEAGDEQSEKKEQDEKNG